MKLIKLLKEAVPPNSQAFSWIDLLEENSVAYPWVDKVDAFLSYSIDNESRTKIKNRFKGINNSSQLVDALTEVLVAVYYKKQEPKFLHNSSISCPDLFLEKSQLYVEIKNINNSDNEKTVLKTILENGQANGIHTVSCSENSHVLEKTYKQINKGLQQIGERKGVVFLVYSLDLIGFYKDHESRKNIFEKSVKSKYGEKVEIKDINSLFFM